MKGIGEWQRELMEAANRKFPHSEWDQLRRVQSIQEQLDDVKAALAVERGILSSGDHAHQDVNHRIAALIADTLMLAEERSTDIESELEKVLAWFENEN